MRVDESRCTAAYIMASRRHGTLYTGSALDLIPRVGDHKQGVGSKFVAKYGVTKLVWFEQFMSEARDREYEIKHWNRDWKVELIERSNPDWNDLFPVLSGAELPRRRSGS
ncbi:GIY-YIG nuclease family protein [Terricaulis silvestris]|uniref:GIY-YIG nuclease superfamily protein n=1 Tax=Terricaulis silvestris TaxID=2686094 RepID=A0A6I6MLX0_9CAUL|nr:GIY-YIG nuclease family protein [Terricaulis silvestris]QGZ93974.1 GIY-YIG nuclease superfamily protein [Terricaulis silvestris]